MDIALGVSVRPTTVHMVLVEGAKADGVTIETDAFDTSAVDGAVAPSASEQVAAAILATHQSARSSGHDLVACGLVIGEDMEVDAYRNSLAARGIDDVALVPELQAAAALARAVGRAVGYSATGVLFLKPWAATLSVVQSADRSMREVSARNLDTTHPLADLTDMLTCLTAHESNPQGLFIVGSGFDLTSLQSTLGQTIPLPVIVPEEPTLALARGAALVAATAPHFDASTAGLAYAQDPEGAESVVRTSFPTGPLAPADEVTQLAAVENGRSDPVGTAGNHVRVRARPLLPVSSLAASIVVLAAVTLAMALASTIEPKVDQRAGVEAEMVQSRPPVMVTPIAPPVVTKSAPAPSQAAPAPNVPLAAVGPPAPRPPSPVPTSVARPAPRTVAAAQTPARRTQVQTSHPTEETPAAVTPAAAPAIVDPPPVAVPALPVPAAVPALPVPAAAPPAPVIPTPSVVLPQIRISPPQPPALRQASDSPSRWSPPSIWIQPPRTQQPQILQAQQDPPWLQIPLWPGPRNAVPAAPPQEVRPSTPLYPQTPPYPQTPLYPQTPQWPQNDSRPWPQTPVLSPPSQSPLVPYSPSPRYSGGSSNPILEPVPSYPDYGSSGPLWPESPSTGVE
jgi:hypothetical protein